MISGIGQSGNDLSINFINNLIKNITDAQIDLTEKLLKADVMEQVEASQSGLGEVIDEFAWYNSHKNTSVFKFFLAQS